MRGTQTAGVSGQQAKKKADTAGVWWPQVG